MAQQLQAQKAAADLAKTETVTAKKKKVTPLNIGRKKGSKVIVNIGSNIDAILPRREDGPCAMSIAVEPMVPHKIKPHPALKVVGAAVTGEDIDGSSSSLAIMYEYNTDAQSSSLSQVSKEEPWNKGYGQMHLVPAISLRNLLDLLSDYEIEFLKTDMQGHDFSAIKSVRLADYSIKRVYNEVYWNDMSSYKGIKNDMCLDWWPEMKRQGYIFEGMPYRGSPRNQKELDEYCEARTHSKARNNTPGLDESDATWRLPSVPPLSATRYHTMYSHHNTHRYTEAEYAACV